MKTLKKYLRKREAAINLILEKPRDEYSISTFHRLRVEIKKLKALFDVVDFCSKEFNRKKIAKPFSEIFRQAGKVRELQLEEIMLKKYFPPESLKDYRNSLRKHRLQNEKVFFLLINKKIIVKLKKKYQIIIPSLAKVKIKKANRYLEKKRNAIETLLSKSSLKTKDLHNVRKSIKSLGYIEKSLPLNKQSKPLSNKNEWIDLLGKWHDFEVIENHLNKTMNIGNLNPKEANQIAKLKTKISMRSKQLLKKIKLTAASHPHLKRSHVLSNEDVVAEVF